MRMTTLIAVALAGCMAGGGAQAQTAVTDAAQAPIVTEVEAFMADYARELIAGDRAALAARYHRGGAWRMGMGRKVFEPWQAIADDYAKGWNKPLAFAWHDISVEPLGPDSAVVLARFDWTYAADKPPARLSYTALLVRREGKLRIRVEDESAEVGK